MAAPLIVTLDLDEVTQSRLDDERRRYFPVERNVLAAHVTLFHALPGAREAEVRRALGELADHPTFPVTVSDLRSLGRGVAYGLEAPEAVRLREAVAQRFHSELTRQDAQRLRPHVTIANKLTPERARALLIELQASFEPFVATATGLSLFRYVGGPWESVESFPFAR